LGVDPPSWSSTQSPPIPALPQGGFLSSLATLGASPPPGSVGDGGLFGSLAKLGLPPMLLGSGGGFLSSLATLGTSLPTPPVSSLAGGPSTGTRSPATPPMPGTLQALFQGLGAAGEQLGQTLNPGAPSTGAQNSPAAEPLGWSDLANPSRIAPKVAYQFAQSSPTLVGGIAGGVIGGRLGALAGPAGAGVGALIGGSLGSAALSAVQTLGPAYRAELQETPNDPEGAWNRAWKQAEISGAFSGASWAVFPARFFQGPVKHLVFQIFGAQPALAVGERVTRNIVDGRPATEGVGEAYGQGVVGGLTLALGHTAVKWVLPKRAPAGGRSPDPSRSAPDERAAAKSLGLPQAESTTANSTASNSAASNPSPSDALPATSPTVDGGPSLAEQTNSKLAQLKKNHAAGTAWEKTTDAEIDREKLDAAPQLTVRMPSGTKTRLDFVTRDRATGEFGRLECKASETAPVRPNQARAFREMEHNEATIVGRGKPGFPGGMKIPPGRVEIRLQGNST
jgi:hypothetical protein